MSRTFPPTTKPTNWGKASSETLKADGFVNCSNNKFDKKDMLALVYDSKKGYTVCVLLLQKIDWCHIDTVLSLVSAANGSEDQQE